jgi:hypothetical protein
MYGLVDDGGALGATDITGRSPSKGAKRYEGGEHEKNNEIGFCGKTWQPSASSISTEDKCLDICEGMLVGIGFRTKSREMQTGRRTKRKIRSSQKTRLWIAPL